MTVAAHGGKLADYPDYEGSEDEYDAEAIEAELERSPFVIRPVQAAADEAPKE